MNDILQKIDEAKHIVVISSANSADSLGSASSFYTYLLKLHKKVSFFSPDKSIEQNLLFIPWTDKIRNSFPSSADLAISFNSLKKEEFILELTCDLISINTLLKKEFVSTCEFLHDFYKNNSIIINKKMATALYSGILDYSDGFTSDKVTGTIFARAKELIECGADYNLCNKFIVNFTTLCAFRLKAYMYKNMQLHNDAKVALICVSDDEMKSSGAKQKDTHSVLRESLNLPTVEIAVALVENSDMSITCTILTNRDVDLFEIKSKYDGFSDSRRVDFRVNSDTSLKSLKIEILKLIDKGNIVEKA